MGCLSLFAPEGPPPLKEGSPHAWGLSMFSSERVSRVGWRALLSRGASGRRRVCAKRTCPRRAFDDSLPKVAEFGANGPMWHSHISTSLQIVHVERG